MINVGRRPYEAYQERQESAGATDSRSYRGVHMVDDGGPMVDGHGMVRGVDE